MLSLMDSASKSNGYSMANDYDKRADAKAAAQELISRRPKPGLSREEILGLIREGRDERDRKALPPERVRRQEN